MCRSAMLKLPLPSMHRKVSLVPGLVSSPCKEGLVSVPAKKGLAGTSPCKEGSGTSPCKEASGTSPCKEGSGTIALAIWTYNTDVWNLRNNYHEK